MKLDCFNRQNEYISYFFIGLAGSIADMQSLLLNVGENVPKGEGTFQKVEDERVRGGCNFRKVCD